MENSGNEQYKTKVTKASRFQDRTILELISTTREVTKRSWFPAGWSHGWKQESGRVGEISKMFDILLTLRDKPGNYNRP